MSARCMPWFTFLRLALVLSAALTAVVISADDQPASTALEDIFAQLGRVAREAQPAPPNATVIAIPVATHAGVERALAALREMDPTGLDFRIVPGAVGTDELVLLTGKEKAVAAASDLVQQMMPISAAPPCRIVPLYHMRDPVAMQALLAAAAKQIAPHSTVIACGTTVSRLPAVAMIGPDGEASRLLDVIAAIDRPVAQAHMTIWALQFSGANRRLVQGNARKAREIIDGAAPRASSWGEALRKGLTAAVAQDGHGDEAEKIKTLSEALHGCAEFASAPAVRKQVLEAIEAWSKDPGQATPEDAADQKGEDASPAGRSADQAPRPDELLRTFDAVWSSSYARDIKTLRSSAGDTEGQRAARARVQFWHSSLASAADRDFRRAQLTPLADQLRALLQKTDRRGLSRLSEVEVIAITGQAATLTGTAHTYTDATAPAKLDESTLTEAEKLLKSIAAYFPAEPASDDAEKEPAAGAGNAAISAIGGAIGGIPAERLLALGLAMGGQTQQWTILKDGVVLTITPYVMPDDDTMELAVNLNVTASPENDTANPANLPLNRVSAHHSTTSIYVRTYQLVVLSSFSLSTTAPKPQWAVPILGQLPLIGEAFRFDRSPDRVYHESLLVICPSIVWP